jgi:zinc protease
MNALCAETLREEEGGTYNVSVTSRISRQPANELTLMYNFSTNPQQAKPLLDKAVSLLCQVAEKGPSSESMKKSREYLYKQYVDYRDTDAYWMSAITDHVRYGSDDMLHTGSALHKVTAKDIQRMARKLERSSNTVEVIMNGAE